MGYIIAPKRERFLGSTVVGIVGGVVCAGWPLKFSSRFWHELMSPLDLQRCWWLELVGGHGSWMWCLLIQLHCWLSFFDFLAMAWRSGVTLGTLSRTLDDRRCLWSWHRGCWGVLRGSRQNERKIGKNELDIDFRNGFFDSFFVSCSFSCSVFGVG